MADHSFPASKRLTVSQEFDAVFKHNQLRLSKPEFLMLARRNDLGSSRLGMVVSKKITPAANQRNRLKRLIREAFRLTELPAIDILVLTRSRVNERSNHQVLSLLFQFFAEITASDERLKA